MPGVTIDKIDIGVYVQFARRTELIEQVRQQYHLQEAGSVPAQALIVDLYPKLSELEMLLGLAALHAPWAYFFPPRRYIMQRRSTFTFHRIIPIFESDEKEKEVDDMLDQVECKSADEIYEKNCIKACLSQVKKLNELLRYIGGRIGQFLQG